MNRRIASHPRVASLASFARPVNAWLKKPSRRCVGPRKIYNTSRLGMGQGWLEKDATFRELAKR